MSGLHFEWLKKGRLEKNPLLKIENLSVRVGIRNVIENMNLEINQGDHILITGPNGSGKSTLLNAIAGIEPAKVEKGSIELNGQNITHLSAHERTDFGISYMRQADNVFQNLTVAENLQLALGDDGPLRFKKFYSELVKSIPLHERAGQLSGGQKKILAIAMIMLRKGSSLILLDEANAGLSDKMDFSNLIEDTNTILNIEHEDPKYD